MQHAALVRSAYIHALCTCKSLAIEDLSVEQQVFCSVLEKRDPALLLGVTEEEVNARSSTLLVDGLSEKLQGQGEDVLAKAALAYMRSPVYTAAVNLLHSS